MHFAPQSKVWVYLSSRAFTGNETAGITAALESFCKEWAAHGNNLKARGDVMFNRFIVLMVDETQSGASGCSIDQSVHFIKNLEQQYKVELFNRLLFAWKVNEQVEVAPLNTLNSLLANNIISENTLVFNPVITTKKELDENWMVPLNKSWMATMLHKEKI